VYVNDYVLEVLVSESQWNLMTFREQENWQSADFCYNID